jgi:glycosyltransferase involved in cell wall biosynthesis
MISIVICSRNSSLLKSVTNSISNTIGVGHELIIIDNADNRHTILSAYNEGVRRSKYDIICFTHEDILFFTPGWGQNVLAHFTDEQVGMIGVTGAQAQAAIPSAWWYHNLFAKTPKNLLMNTDGRSSNDGKLYQYLNRSVSSNKEEVVIIDGLWFCIRKELFNKISFDEKTFTGFHLYDADISMQVGLYAKRYIVFDVLMQHMNSGNISADYYTDLVKFADKWKDSLPQQTAVLPEGYSKKTSWIMLRSFILDLVVKKFPKSFIRDIKDKYVAQLKAENYSVWHMLYFKMAAVLGYQKANSVFYRIEKMAGVTNGPGYSLTVYQDNNITGLNRNN